MKSNSAIGLILLALVLSLFVSCSPDNSTPNIKYVDIADAKALVIVPTNQNIRSTNSSENHFCKITEDGKITEVIAKNENGENCTIIPNYVFNAGEYVIISLNGSSYLVSRKTGTTYDMSSIGTPSIMRNNLGYDRQGRQSVFTDYNNNIYFIMQGRVAKIDVSDVKKITFEYVTPDLYYINETEEFAVDKNGNIVFSAGSSSGALAGSSLYMRKTNGSIEKISPLQNSMAFTGYDGFIYLQINEPDEHYSTDSKMLKRVSVDNAFTISYTDCNQTGLTSWYSGGYNWIYMKDKIVAIGYSDSGFLVTSVMYDASRSNYYNTFTSIKQSLVEDIVAGSEYCFASLSDDTIIQLNPVDGTYTAILDKGSFDVCKIVSANDNNVSFSGVRYSDGKRILGTIDVSTKAVSIVSDNLSDDIVVLQKLN